MQKIQAALYDPGNDLRVVLVRAPGGYGKTRMLREVMRRAGHQGERQSQGAPGPAEDWYAAQAGRLHISDLVDMTWVRLATTIHFQHQLQMAFSAEGSGFFNFSRCFLRYRDQLTYQSDPEQMDKALQEAELAFRKDYQMLSRQRRMVWVLDTAEKFAWPGADWAPPLPPEHAGQSDYQTRTADWLGDIVRSDWLRNTTILIAGRDKYDWPALFKTGAATLCDVPLAPFDLPTTRAYFGRLALEWKQQQPESPFIDVFEDLTEAERAEVLWLYTGGQPVRLALFTDVMLEGKYAPEQLSVSAEDARGVLKWDGEQADPDRLAEEQRRLEANFLDILFTQPDSLRSQILAVLVRAQRPMNAACLTFLLDSKPKETIDEWQPDAGKVQEISKALEEMRTLSFIKFSPTGEYWLQDEIYDLYDRRHGASGASAAEIRERKRVYNKVIQYLDSEIRKHKQQLRDFWRQDRRQLLMEAGHEAARQGDLSPLQVEMIRFAPATG